MYTTKEWRLSSFMFYVLCSKLIQSNKSIGNYSKKGFPGLFG